MDFEDNNPLSANDNESIIDGDILNAAKDQLVPNESLEDLQIVITDAGKSRESAHTGHITYTIKVGSKAVRRRYSEFESLRRCLRRLFPTIVVPPIPEKHPLTAYAANPTHAQEDVKIIEHRRRMLTAFLNRCAAIPELSRSWLFERFLDPNASWNEVLVKVELPKTPLQAPPLDPTHPKEAHQWLPIPPSGTKFKDDDFFKQAEASAKEYELVIGGGLEKSVRRINKHFAALAADSADLGGQLNAFSLETSPPSFSQAVEKAGQAVDTGYISTEMLTEQLAVEFSEPLTESVQLAATARQVLKYRRYRALQVTMTEEALKSKQQHLAQLEKAESEAQRISTYLHADERIAQALGNSPVDAVDPDDEVASVVDEVPSEAENQSSQPQSSARFRLPGLSQINHAIHGMMDVDPESSRRGNITRTKESIDHLKEALEVAKEDSMTSSDAVKQELSRYKASNEADVRKLVKAFVRCHIAWAERNIESWLEARAALDN